MKQVARAFFLLLALGILGQPGSASAVTASPNYTTFIFTGLCTDCSRAAEGLLIPVQAELTLLNYALGDQITTANFFSFHYDGSNLAPATTISDALDGINGTIDSPLPSSKNFRVFGSNAYFYSSTDGSWDFGLGRTSFDTGTAGIYQGAAAAVPEPVSLALLGAGLAGTALVRRRRA